MSANGAAVAPLADTVSGHLRNALQMLNLLEYAGGVQGNPEGFPAIELQLNGIRARVEVALVQVEQLRAEAKLHPFSFARHVAETL